MSLQAPLSISFFLASFALLPAACPETSFASLSADSAKLPGKSSIAVATAILRNAEGKDMGRAVFRQARKGISVDLSASGLAPGLHGVHVHMTGKCDAPDFKTAGAHWNPTQHQHGLANPQGAHLGDMPNMTAGANDAGKIRFTIPGATIAGGDHPMLDEDGAAIVIHAGPDDMKTDPAGNSGGRIACGVIVAG